MYKLMTAGPTMVRANVMNMRSQAFTNPDLDMEFFDFYKETCEMLSEIVHTKSKAFILGGEGILGLEAACAAFTEKGDRVLVIDNGIFGKGFKDFVELYDGEVVVYKSDYRNPVDVEDLRNFLEKDHNFKYATLVHCDTPSGVLNDISTLCDILKSYGILTVVDTVAGLFGEYVNMDQSRIDIICGGSQKALSAPPGLTMMWVSDDGWKSIEDRKTPIKSFYANISLFKDYYGKKEFPYTMPISDIMALRVAIENVLADDNILTRHRKIAMAVRGALRNGGLKLYLESGWSNTVTVFEVPEGVTDEDILETMKKDSNVMISGCFDVLAGKVVRIGHMGENATAENLVTTLEALQKALTKLGVQVGGDMPAQFARLMV